MSSDFTKAERNAILHAFTTIEAELERAPWDYKSTWQDAFKLEARQCSNRDWARALMVEHFAEGVRKPRGAADLFRTRPGCREAHIVGAALLDRAMTHHDRDRSAIAVAFIRDDLMHLCDLASAAQQSSRERRLERAQAGKGG